MRTALAGFLVTLSACGFQVAGGSAGDGGTDGQPPSDADGAVDGDPPDDEMLPDGSSACLDGVYCRRRKLTVAPPMISGGPHVNFPLLVQIATDPDLGTRTRADGFDIVFTTTTGARLAHERQSWVKATGSLTAWVTLPALTTAPTTELYLWYGNPNATDQQSAMAWPETYKGVYHFDTAAADSSRFANPGSATAGFGGTGKVGGAAVFDQATDQVAIAGSGSLDSVGSAGTFEMWVNFVDSSAGRVQLLLSNPESLAADPLTSDGYSLGTQEDGDYYLYPWVRGSNYNLATNPFSAAGWHYAAATFDFATKTVRLFADGAQLGIVVMNVSNATWTQVANPSTWFLGMNSNNVTSYFAGLMDEVRITAEVRSPQWLTTTYNNISAPSTFVTLGALETLQ